MPNRERIVVFEDLDESERPVREAAPTFDVQVWRGCGPERGEWEDAHNDNAVGGEYTPPPGG